MQKKSVNIGKNIILYCAVAVASWAGNALAQQYPTKPVRMVVPFAPGGPTDVIARLIAQKLSEVWGHQVVIDNRAGAGGNIGMGMGANAAPDGYTITVVSSSFVVNPSLYAKIPYDPFKSFIPVTNAAASPNVFIAHPSVPIKSMQDIIGLTKKEPKKYSFATPGVGTTPDFSAELFRRHVIQRADRHSGIGLRLRADNLRDSEVRDADRAGFIQHDVTRLDVAMNDVARMRMIQSRSGFLENPSR